MRAHQVLRVALVLVLAGCGEKTKAPPLGARSVVADSGQRARDRRGKSADPPGGIGLSVEEIGKRRQLL